MTSRHAGLSACILAVLLLGLSLFGGHSVLGAAEPPHVMGAWVRLPAVSGRPAGGYVMVHGTAKPDMLVGVTSPMAGRVELHSMKTEAGVMKMRAEAGLPVPANGALELAPGGSHMMIFGLAPGAKAGARIPLTLLFKSGARVTVQAEARGAAAAAPASDAADHH